MTSTTASPPSWTWRRRTALLVLGVLSLNACYMTTPMTGQVAPESRLVLDISDQGRVAYGERLGPSVQEVEGIVESANDSAYVLRVSSVRYLNGRSQRWSGEPFTLSTQHVARVRQREFSRGRTAVVGAALGAALVAAVLSVKFLGRGAGDGRGDPGGGGGSEQ